MLYRYGAFTFEGILQATLGKRPMRQRFQDDAAFRKAAIKGYRRLLFIFAMATLEIAVMMRYGASDWVWPVLASMAAFVLLNRLFDF